jgi:hypothetical protein
MGVSDPLPDTDWTDWKAKILYRFGSLNDDTSLGRNSIENGVGFGAGKLENINGFANSPKIHNRRATRDQDELGGPCGIERRAFRMRGRIDHDKVGFALGSRLQGFLQASRLDRKNGRKFLSPAVMPFGRAGLRVQVNEKRIKACPPSCGRHVQGNGGLARAAFLIDESQNVHMSLMPRSEQFRMWGFPIVHMFLCAQSHLLTSPQSHIFTRRQ